MFIAIQAYPKKQEKKTTTNKWSNFTPKGIIKRRKTKQNKNTTSKVSRKQGMIKTGVKINKIENKKIEKIKETESCVFLG